VIFHNQFIFHFKLAQMKFQLLLIALACFVFKYTQAAYCHGSPDEGERTNDAPVLKQKESDYTFIKEVR